MAARAACVELDRQQCPVLDEKVLFVELRRPGLVDLEKRVLPLFVGRVLPFDMTCTNAYAALVAKARTAGLAIATADGYIAASAIADGFAVATRDTRPFQVAGLTVIDPREV